MRIIEKDEHRQLFADRRERLHERVAQRTLVSSRWREMPKLKRERRHDPGDFGERLG